MDVIYQSRLWNVFILIFHLSLICILEEALDLIQLKVKNLGNTDGKNVFCFVISQRLEYIQLFLILLEENKQGCVFS